MSLTRNVSSIEQHDGCEGIFGGYATNIPRQLVASPDQLVASPDMRAWAGSYSLRTVLGSGSTACRRVGAFVRRLALPEDSQPKTLIPSTEALNHQLQPQSGVQGQPVPCSRRLRRARAIRLGFQEGSREAPLGTEIPCLFVQGGGCEV